MVIFWLVFTAPAKWEVELRAKIGHYRNRSFGSKLKIFRIELRNASTTPSKSNQLRNVNTIRWESRNITNQPGEIDDWKSEVIAFVVNAGMNITANNFYI